MRIQVKAKVEVNAYFDVVLTLFFFDELIRLIVFGSFLKNEHNCIIKYFNFFLFRI